MGRRKRWDLGTVPDLDATGRCVLSTPFSVSVVSLPLRVDLLVSDSTRPRPHPFPPPDRRAAWVLAAAAWRLRGRGSGDCGQEAGLVVIFGYLAV